MTSATHPTSDVPLTSPLCADASYAQRVRSKIHGRLVSQADEDSAVERIMDVRAAIRNQLLQITSIPTQALVQYLDQSGFYYRPSSPRGHHNHPGGLAEHSLGIYRLLAEWNALSPEERMQHSLYRYLHTHPLHYHCALPPATLDDEVAFVAAIGHDLCKAERFYFDGCNIRQHHEADTNHSSLSAKRLARVGITPSRFPDLLRAVRTHMRLFSFKGSHFELADRALGRQSPLCVLLYTADKVNASQHPANKSVK